MTRDDCHLYPDTHTEADHSCPDNPSGGPHEASDSLCPDCMEYDCDIDGHRDPTEVNLCVWCLDYDVVAGPDSRDDQSDLGRRWLRDLTADSAGSILP